MTLWVAGWLAWIGGANAEPEGPESRFHDVAARSIAIEALELAAVDGDCGELPERADSVPAAAARANAGDVVVVVVDGTAPSVDDVVELVEVHDIDLVAVEGDACAEAGVLREGVRTIGSGLFGDVWRWEAERELSHAVDSGLLVVLGDGLVAVHRPTADPVEDGPVATADVAASATEGAWLAFVIFAVAVVAVFVALVYLGLRRERKPS